MPPAPPPSLTLPDEYAWGDETASRDERMARHITDRLRERFGQARESHYVAQDIEAVESLEQWYATSLGDGWRPLELTGAFGPGEQGFGFFRNNRAIIVAWLEPPQPGGRVPVTLFSYGE